MAQPVGLLGAFTCSTDRSCGSPALLDVIWYRQVSGLSLLNQAGWRATPALAGAFFAGAFFAGAFLVGAFLACA